MASTTIFKRLFEVQVLHDYYLTTADGVSFFDQNEADKNDLLSKKMVNRLYDVRDLFEIEADYATKENFSKYKLVLANTVFGFMVGTEVSVENKSGEILYKPRFKFDDNPNFTFSIKPRAPFLKSITNIGLRPVVPSIHYFTNKDKDEFDEDTVPSYKSLPISNKVSTHQDNKSYEMGALADFAGTIKEALQYTTGNDPGHWEEIADKRFVSDADNILLPHRFTYKIAKSQNITQIEIVLLDKDSNEVKTINKAATEALENIDLDLSKVDENDENSALIPSDFYTLKVIANAEPEVFYSIYLNDEMYNKDHLAVVDIRMDEQDSPFSLLDTEGYLKTRISATDEKITHPVFEIRFKNRRTYWRYNKEGDFSPAEIAATAEHLAHDPEKLTSIKPKALTETLVPFKNGTSLVLPYPSRPSIKIEKERIFSEIFINPSNRLLNSS